MKLFEDLYPGNASVLDKLFAAIDGEGVTAFTGAGTSMPAMPGWGQLVSNLIDGAKKEGRLDEPSATALHAEASDLLYVVDEIYNAVGKSQVKSEVAKIFSNLERATDAHKLIVMSKFDRLMTLNYDQGLEIAYAEERARHLRSITPRQKNEIDDWIRRGGANDATPVLHWHGQASDAESIILAGSDYVHFYDLDSSNKETLRNIFKTQRVLMIGFGFSDPFIERELNSVMQPLPQSNSHFAIIGVGVESAKNIQIERRKYATKYKLETIFYPVKKGSSGSDHSALISILEAIRAARPCQGNVATTTASNSVSPASAASGVSHRSSLFTIGDKQIYCEPNIWSSVAEASGAVEAKTSICDIMSAKFHCCISAPHEYGLSNVGRRLASDLALVGKKAIFRDARSFPKYRKAIQAEQDFIGLSNSEDFTLILDNFSSVDHQRTVRELIATYENIRIVVLQRTGFGGSLDDDLAELNFQLFHLSGLSRSDIRGVINIIAPDYNSDLTSTVVDKVYSDLLQLCIPLTPSNVIMYASVLCKDGSFSPVSRLHIVDRFTSEAVRRASDAYADTFNSMNKLDLVASFCFGLFSNGATSFIEAEWRSFCEQYKADNLVDFSSLEILGDLVEGRVLSKDGSLYNFRYRMFYSYFVGRHLASRPDLLTSCIAENRHLELNGLVEVLCGMVPDCSEILEDLTAKLAGSLDAFYNHYPIKGLDFHEGVKWDFASDDRGVWDAVSEKIENGPASTQELDELKTSIHAERRTADQKVSIIKFIASEKNVTLNAWYLTTALENAKHASAASKKAAAAAVINGQVLAYEVASVFVPLIAEKKYVSWNGFTYINLIEDKNTQDESADQQEKRERMHGLVTYALPSSMGGNLADLFGSRKLGQVFLALIEEPELDTPIKSFMLYCLLIRSKPTGWLASTKRRVSSLKRDDIYLRHMLNVSVRQFRDEINTETERLQLKELIASVRLRREVNIKVPSPSEIKKVIGRLENSGYWSDEAKEQ